MNPKIELYFDYVSPYALLAWEKSKKLCQMKGWTLIPRPVVFGALLDHWGHKGPAEVPPKREFVFRDAMRKCSAAGRGSLSRQKTRKLQPSLWPQG
jgi:2-hydroxychromene-2-carboxylate isomerase